MRHQFTIGTYHGSVDLFECQELLGHSKPETTWIYIQLPGDTLCAALQWAA